MDHETTQSLGHVDTQMERDVLRVILQQRREQLDAANARIKALTEQRDRLREIVRGLLLWHDGGEPEDWTQQQVVDDLHKHLAAARAAIVAAYQTPKAEGDGT